MTIPVSMAKTQPNSILGVVSPVKSVRDSKPYRYIETLASIAKAIQRSHVSVIGFERISRIWNIAEATNNMKICKTQWSLENIMTRLVTAHLIKVRGFQYRPAKESVFNP